MLFYFIIHKASTNITWNTDSNISMQKINYVKYQHRFYHTKIMFWNE